MRNVTSFKNAFLLCLFSLALSACANRSHYSAYSHQNGYDGYIMSSSSNADYASRIPDRINTGGKKVVVVDPSEHVWGAYDENGDLIKAGLATAGGNYCEDIGRGCRTSVGTFRVYSLGDASCKSRIYPLPNGGGLMPYCMYFSGGEALHGSPDGAVVEANISHGCVRMRIADAEWLRNNFVTIGTRVIVRPYTE